MVRGELTETTQSQDLRASIQHWYQVLIVSTASICIPPYTFSPTPQHGPGQPTEVWRSDSRQHHASQASGSERSRPAQAPWSRRPGLGFGPSTAETICPRRLQAKAQLCEERRSSGTSTPKIPVFHCVPAASQRISSRKQAPSSFEVPAAHGKPWV